MLSTTCMSRHEMEFEIKKLRQTKDNLEVQVTELTRLRFALSKTSSNKDCQILQLENESKSLLNSYTYLERLNAKQKEDINCLNTLLNENLSTITQLREDKKSLYELCWKLQNEK